MLFQAGYLAIKDVRQRDTFISYTLGFPNLEVSAAFNSSLLDLFSENAQRNEMQMNMYFSLEDQDPDQFKAAIHALFAGIPYHNYTNNEIARYEGFLCQRHLCLACFIKAFDYGGRLHQQGAD